MSGSMVPVAYRVHYPICMVNIWLSISNVYNWYRGLNEKTDGIFV